MDFTVSKTGTITYKHEYSGTAPYRIYKNGKLQTDWGLYSDPDSATTTTNNTEWTETGDEYEPPILEILDANDSYTPQQVLYPPFVTLQWRGISGCLYYLVEKYVAAAWTFQDRVPEDGKGYVVWESDSLDDVTTHQYRVTPYDSSGYAGLTIEFDIFLVRTPAAPEVAFSYSNPNITVSAR